MTPLRRRMIVDMTQRNLAPKTIESDIQRISGLAATWLVRSRVNCVSHSATHKRHSAGADDS
jgi:hypothetical protein